MNDINFDKALATGDPLTIAAAIEHSRLQARILATILAILGVLMVVLAFSVLLVSRYDNRNAINHLTAQLDEARAIRTEIDLCQSKFDTLVGNAARESNVGETELVILIATVPPNERDAVIGDKVMDLRVAAETYRQAGLDRGAWVDADKPLPCPI